MTVSRRLRFEVLRRDGFTCRYCGAPSPEVVLTVDHVIPVTLGGDDDPRNLIAACQSCNAGKSSVAPDAALVEEVDATALLFAGAIERIATQRRSEQAAIDELAAQFDRIWRHGFDGAGLDRDPDWRNTVGRLYELGLDINDMRRFVDVAMSARHVASSRTNVWRYFCGCCWREITTRHELARRLLEDGDI